MLCGPLLVSMYLGGVWDLTFLSVLFLLCGTGSCGLVVLGLGGDVGGVRGEDGGSDC